VTFKDVQTDIPFKQSQPQKQTDVDAAVAALKQRTGVRDVTLDLEPEADGVRVVFILHPAIYVGMYEFPAALKNFSYSRLVQVANYNPQTPYSTDDVQQAKDALVQLFASTATFWPRCGRRSNRLATSAWSILFSCEPGPTGKNRQHHPRRRQFAGDRLSADKTAVGNGALARSFARVGVAKHQDHTFRFRVNQLAPGPKHRRQRAFASHQRECNIEAALLSGEQLVEVVGGNTAGNRWIFVMNQQA